MNQKSSKPLTLPMLGAAAVPFAGYVSFVVTDALACGSDHARLMGVLSFVIMLGASVGAAAFAGIVVGWRPGALKTGPIMLVLAVLAVAAAVGGMEFGTPHAPLFCDIQL